MNQIVITIISTLVTAFVLPLITLAGTRFMAWINTKIKNERAVAYMLHSKELVKSAVKAVSQTYVDSLKKDGSFDKEAQKEALRKASEIVNLLICPHAKRYINEKYSEFDSWLNVEIEAALDTIKKTLY